MQKMRKEGLDSAQYNIFSMNSKIVLNEHGLLARNYDDVFDTYSDEQSRWNGCDLSFTTNNWLSSELAIGKQKYTLNGVQYEEYGVNANFVLAGKIIGGDIYSANYSSANKVGTHINLLDGSFSFGGDKLVYDASNETLSMKNGTFTTSTIKGSDFIGGHLLIGDENKVGTYAEITSDGTLNAKGVNIRGGFIAESGMIGGWNINNYHQNEISCDYDIYRTYIQPARGSGTWVLSAQTRKDGTYYGKWYVRADGYMHAENAYISGSIEGSTITGSTIRTGTRTKLFENVVGLYIGEDGLDYCWNMTDEWVEGGVDNIPCHFRISAGGLFVIVGNKEMMRFNTTQRIGGGNIGYSLYTPRLFSSEVLYTTKLAQVNTGA